MFTKQVKITFIIFLILLVIGIIFMTDKDKSNDIDDDTLAEQIFDNQSCGFTLVYPKVNDTVSQDFTVEGIVDNTKREELGCGWTVFEGQAGVVHIYDTRGFSVGSALLTTNSEWMTSEPVTFFANIKIDIEPEDKNLLMVIEEDDPADLGHRELLQIPLKYKK